jgi:two-component system KDP operon response regulator KdpE
VNSESITVLVVDDEPQIRRLVRNALLEAPPSLNADDDQSRAAPSVRVIEADTGQKGIDLAAAERPMLIVLDLGLPDMQGLDVCREIRRWSSAPILVLSARHADTEKATLLDAGADDYMTKPFSTIELMARVRAQLRRIETRAPSRDDRASIVSFGSFSVDAQRRRIERDGTPIRLTPTEWSLLQVFIAHPRQTLTHRQLFLDVWGNTTGDAQQYLRVYVGHLRRKLEDDPVRPRFIQTDSGVGYRFEPDGEGS